MRVLLDTRAFLWWISESSRLSESARETITDAGNEVIFSAVSAWEISLKAGVGKLVLPDTPAKFVADQLLLLDFEILPVRLDHALRVYELPTHHQDPFDRLLVSQAIVEETPILSADPLIARYPVEVIW